MGAPDLSEFIALGKTSSKAPCQVGAARGWLDEADAAKLDAAVAAGNVQVGAGAIVKWLDMRGHKASLAAVNAHRQGTCSCND